MPDIAAALLDLDDAMTGSPTEVVVQSAGWRTAVPLALGALLVGGLVAAVVAWSVTRPMAPLVSQFTVSSPSDPGIGVDKISPDGRTIAFASGGGDQDPMYVRRLDEREAVPLRGAEGMFPFAFSPDGKWVLVSDGSVLEKFLLEGGPAISVTDDAFGGADWGPDDLIVSGANDDGLWTVSAAGGDLRQLIEPAEGENGQYYAPRFLPSGRAVIFYVFNNSPEASQVAVYDFDTGQHWVLLSGTSPQFTTSGHLIFFRDGSLWAVPFDPDRLEMRGEPRPVVEGVGVNSLGFAHYSVADNGTLMYRPRGGGGGETLVWVDRESREEPLPYSPANYSWPRISPDGRSLLVTIHDENTDVWISELARGTLSRLTTHDGFDQYSLWSPDSERVVFSSAQEGGPWSIYQKNADGAGPEEKLLTWKGPGNARPHAWSSDGMLLLFDYASQSGLLTASDIGLLSMEADEAWELLLQTEANEASPALSPDGDRIAYVSDETGRFEVYVERFPKLGDRRLISTAGGVQPLWSPDGRELFYGEGQRLMSVSIDWEPSFTPGPPEVVFEGRMRLTSTSPATTYTPMATVS